MAASATKLTSEFPSDSNPRRFMSNELRNFLTLTYDELEQLNLIDFGPEIGLKRSSAQVTHYARGELEGSLVVGVVNFPPRQIGPVRSEVLVLGALDEERGVVLLRPDRGAEPGSRIG